MNLSARLERLEQKHAPADAYESMSIEEIMTTLDALDQEIEAQVGMPLAEYADAIEAQIGTGTLEGLLSDEVWARRFIDSVREINIERARTMHQENSFYPRFLKGCMGSNGKFVA